jgi:hypothetical protein
MVTCIRFDIEIKSHEVNISTYLFREETNINGIKVIAMGLKAIIALKYPP